MTRPAQPAAWTDPLDKCATEAPPAEAARSADGRTRPSHSQPKDGAHGDCGRARPEETRPGPRRRRIGRRSRLIPPLLEAAQSRMNPRPGLDMQVLRKCQAFFPLLLSAFRLRIDGWRRPFGNQNGVTTVVRPLVRKGNHQPRPLARSVTPGTCYGCDRPRPGRADARGWRACAPS
jgi:hypothetical protein